MPFLKALEHTNGCQCPGEVYCTSSNVNIDVDLDENTQKKLDTFRIGGSYGKQQGRTLANYCHNKPPSIKGGLLKGCPLFGTKPDEISNDLQLAIEVAEYFRELKELNLLPKLEDISAYEFTCYKSAERAVRKVQNDSAQEQKEKNESGNKSKQGDGSALKF